MPPPEGISSLPRTDSPPSFPGFFQVMSMQRLMMCATLGCLGALALGLGACVTKIDPTSPATKEMPEGRPCPLPASMISDAESNSPSLASIVGFANSGGSQPTAGAGGSGGGSGSDGGATLPPIVPSASATGVGG